MRRLGLIIILIGATFSSQAQSDFMEKKPISISYFGHYGFHPGLKIGTQYDWRSWEKRKEKKKRTKVKTKSLFVSPQLGMYVHPGNHTGLLLNADFGYQRVKDRFGFYSAWSVGLGYLTQFNAGTTYVRESDGSITAKKWASKGYFLPTLNYEFGQQITDQIGWFGKMSVGSRLGYNTGVSFENFTELGIKLNLGK